ncbi:uncharacterized protein AB675_3319 [Cyphellophora attinorum]|uniref:Uncharacterized protein n=1 Tax=Cyphellophora attinorum TaxID=1664694 RepID=A0A0N1H3U4_9EURO|nr:uncharacterized protein AB675_3319 [Phialophora attinorum]KPI39670.1 hypothetical protein AB675_3319 [Phialophora attinorum]
MSIDDRPNNVNQTDGFTKQSKDQLAVLPDKILLQIFEALGRITKKNLCSVSRLNRRYHRLGDAVLYKTLLLETPELHLTFSESLGRRPRRASIIVEVKLAYPSAQLAQLALDTPARIHYDPSNSLSRMSNLEKLEISLPDVLLRGIGNVFNGPFDLACLKTCSLFYQTADEQYWDLRENIHVFTIPSLERLTITRAKLDERGFDFLERPSPTDLKVLHLIDCDINDDGLSDLLEFPTGLEEFVMTQAAEPEPELEESSDTFSDYISALNSQRHSIKSVTIDSASLSGRKVLRMREYQELTTLRMNWDYQLFGKTSKKPRLQSVGLPPKLEKLEFLNPIGTDEEVTDLLLSLIQNKSVVADKLKTLIIVEGEDGVSRDIVEACKEQNLELHMIAGQ